MIKKNNEQSKIKLGVTVLPVDIWTVVFRFSQLKDLPKLVCLNKSILEACSKDWIWKDRFLCEYPCSIRNELKRFKTSSLEMFKLCKRNKVGDYYVYTITNRTSGSSMIPFRDDCRHFFWGIHINTLTCVSLPSKFKNEHFNKNSCVKIVSGFMTNIGPQETKGGEFKGILVGNLLSCSMMWDGSEMFQHEFFEFKDGHSVSLCSDFSWDEIIVYGNEHIKISVRSSVSVSKKNNNGEFSLEGKYPFGTDGFNLQEEMKEVQSTVSDFLIENKEKIGFETNSFLPKSKYLMTLNFFEKKDEMEFNLALDPVKFSSKNSSFVVLGKIDKVGSIFIGVSYKTYISASFILRDGDEVNSECVAILFESKENNYCGIFMKYEEAKLCGEIVLSST